ncbi:MAG TPA: TonB-dependent receptor, partial [Myxococcales bacterium]
RFSDLLALALDAEGLTTSGYPVIAAPGPIDHDASSRRGNAQLRLESGVGSGFTASARAAGFSESEDGGTLDTTARARQGEIALGLDGHGLEAHLYGRLARFDQDRATIAPNPFVRASASLASIQGAPADDEGLSAVFHAEGFSAGVEARRVAGRSVEQLFPTQPGIVHRETAGEQLLGGIFAEQLLRLADVDLQGALRLDGWRNRSSGRVETLSSGAVQETELSARSDLQLSPRLGALWKPLSWLGVRAAGYRSFRAPTLNELYRPFQVGPVRTDGNPQLGPETLTGAEAGFDLFGLAHATGFWSRLEDPIVNVTVGPNLAQRRNLGAARIAGIELRVQSPSVGGARLDFGWTYVRTRVIGSSDDGRELPQDPHHRVSAGVIYDGWVSAEVRLRWTSDQSEDDLNTERLPGFATFDAYVSRKLSQAVTIFGAAENVLDRRYLVGLQGGVATLGQPLSVRGGIRLAL